MVITTNIVADIVFWPEDGAFRSKLVEMAIDNVDEESVDLFSEDSCEMQVSVSNQSDGQYIIRCIVVSDLGEQTLNCDLSELSQEELNDFKEQLAHQIALLPSPTHGTPKIVIRKNMNGMLDCLLAAQKLKCSQLFLKENIPCTDYSYNEINGKKQIKEYYWSKVLIDRLCQVISHGANEDDVKYIAEECCNGDNKWAKEILALIGKPIRSGFKPKPFPKLHNGESSRGIKKRQSEFISKTLTNPRSKGKPGP